MECSNVEIWILARLHVHDWITCTLYVCVSYLHVMYSPTVRALEAAKALGSTDSAEDILQAVAEKIEDRQRQQPTKAS